MSIFDWFRERNPFETFKKRVGRLRTLLSVMEKEAEREHFQQLKGHLRSTVLLIGSKELLDKKCLVYLLEKERKITNKEPESQKKQILQGFENDAERYLEIFVRTLQDASQLCEQALGSWQNKQLLQKLRDEIDKKIIFLEKTIVNLKHLAEVQSKEYDTIKEEARPTVALPSPIPIEGTMSNGWRLSTIQRVVRQLGAYIVQGGKHDYKIVIPWASRPHTLSKDLEPYGFASSLAKLLGIPKERLIESFNKGELVP